MLLVGVGKRVGAYLLFRDDLSSKAAPVWNNLEAYRTCAGGLSAVNAIGTQLRGPINSGMAR